MLKSLVFLVTLLYSSVSILDREYYRALSKEIYSQMYPSVRVPKK